MQALELRREEREQRAVHLCGELGALPRVDGRVVPTRGGVVRREGGLLGLGHAGPEARVDLSCGECGREGRDEGREGGERGGGELAAAELGEELLLGREVEVLVRHDGVPDGAHVGADPIGRDPLVVLALEDGRPARTRTRTAAGARAEALAQVGDLLLEELGLEQLVRQRDKVEVEEVVDPGRLEALGLAQAVPQPVQVGCECRAQVRERGRADVVTNDKEEERLVLRAATSGKKGSEPPVDKAQEQGSEHGPDSLAAGLALLLGSEEQAEVDLEDGLEQAHVGALVQPDLVLPDVDEEHLGDGHAEEGRLALKVLCGGVR